VFEVADLAEGFCDAGALGAHFALGPDECVFGVEGALLSNSQDLWIVGVIV
jgi:hypothetical protein